MFELGHGLMLYVIVMTLGEFELNDIILEEPFAPFELDVRVLLGALMFLMTIVLMNLTVRCQLSFPSLLTVHSVITSVVTSLFLSISPF